MLAIWHIFVGECKFAHMRKLTLLFVFLFSGTAQAQLGMNLSTPTYYGGTVPWVDVWRQRDPGETTDGNTWATGHESSFPRDAQGYPRSAPVGADMLRYSVFTPVYGGDYVVSWLGTGRISFPALPGTHTDSDHRIVLHLPAGTDPVFLRIDQSSAADPIHEIHIVGQSIPTTDGVYNSDFLSQLRGFSVLRCMDWLQTNDSPRREWSDMPVDGGPGTTYRTCIETANKINANAWITIPIEASDAFILRAVDELARAVRPVLVELSNEVWNGQFSQLGYAQQQGLSAGLETVGVFSAPPSTSGTQYWAGLKWYARRAGFITSKIAQKYRTKGFMVLAGQSSEPALNAALLDSYADTRINPFGGRPEAFAVAPYCGWQRDQGYTASTVDQVLADAAATIPAAVSDTQQNLSIAHAHGTRLIAYEAGQHLVSLTGDPAMTALFIAANRDPRMGALYDTYLRQLQQVNPDVLTLFNSCEPPNKYGSWGALERQNAPHTPKMDAIRGVLGVQP